MAACRIFGYTQGELLNHNVEKLMPAFHAKHHQKQLRNALVRGPDHVSNKEHFAFAQHKSGYVFPIFMQFKLI